MARWRSPRSSGHSTVRGFHLHEVNLHFHFGTVMYELSFPHMSNEYV